MLTSFFRSKAGIVGMDHGGADVDAEESSFVILRGQRRMFKTKEYRRRLMAGGAFGLKIQISTVSPLFYLYMELQAVKYSDRSGGYTNRAAPSGKHHSTA